MQEANGLLGNVVPEEEEKEEAGGEAAEGV